MSPFAKGPTISLRGEGPCVYGSHRFAERRSHENNPNSSHGNLGLCGHYDLEYTNVTCFRRRKTRSSSGRCVRTKDEVRLPIFEKYVAIDRMGAIDALPVVLLIDSPSPWRKYHFPTLSHSSSIGAVDFAAAEHTIAGQRARGNSNVVNGRMQDIPPCCGIDVVCIV